MSQIFLHPKEDDQMQVSISIFTIQVLAQPFNDKKTSKAGKRTWYTTEDGHTQGVPVAWKPIPSYCPTISYYHRDQSSKDRGFPSPNLSVNFL